MCGIAGIIQRNAAVDPQALEVAARRLQHRGPDDSGIECHKNVGLVHTRLSIIDLAAGHQPLSSHDGHLSLVANGEIYNFVELRAAQAAQGLHFKTRSDCEQILGCYQADGEAGFVDLVGMYAFALHDRRANTLYLCRDRLGIKPLYYAHLSDRVVFASELKAMLALLPGIPEVNPSALNQFLQNQFNTGRETIFKGIYRVLPGEWLAVDTRNLSLRHQQYWSALAVEPSDSDFDSALQQFDALFADVMQQHLRADVPLGLFLSGGIDSSVLLAELVKQQGSDLQTYSIGYQGAGVSDELDAASALARQFGTRHRAFRVNRAELFARIPHVIWATDDLMRDFACLPTSFLAEAAGEDLKVVFSGEGGDEAFAGYRRYAPALEKWFKRCWRGTGGFRTRGQWQQRTVRNLLTPELQQQQARQPFIDAWNACPKDWSDMQRAQYVDLTTALPDNLFVKADRIMMAFGLEGRVPFADHRLVELGLGLADAHKLRSKRGKWLIRQWAHSHLPREHLAQPKRGFHVPVREWMSGAFLTRLGDQLVASPALKPWFKTEGIRNLVRRQEAQSNCHRELWCLMQFAIWHKLFVDNPGCIPDVQDNPLDWVA